MDKSEAQTIVIDVATKRKPHTRKALAEAVAMLEAEPAVKSAPVKKAAAKKA
jgi:hypothetical protein